MSDAIEQRWPPVYGPIALVVGLVLGVFGGVVVDLLAHAGGSNLNNLSPGVTDVQTIVQDAGFVIAPIYLATRIGPVRPSQFGLSPSRPLWRAVALVLVGLGLFYLLSFAWFAALNASGEEKKLVKDLGGSSGTLGILAACAVTCVVAPICEELLFRGFIFRALRNWRGVWPRRRSPESSLASCMGCPLPRSISCRWPSSASSSVSSTSGPARSIRASPSTCSTMRSPSGSTSTGT